MTMRDNAWSAAVEASMIVMGGGKIYSQSQLSKWEGAPPHSPDEFCHNELIYISEHLEPKNKKTIKRTLNEMCEKGFLERIEEHRMKAEARFGDRFMNTVPISYTPSEKLKSMVRFANRQRGRR